MMKGVILVAMMVAATQALSLVPVPEPLPVDSLCAATSCLIGTVCRVVQQCAGPACPPSSACVPCVPSGVDDVCNRNRYIFAVLVGQGGNPSQLEERKCDPSQLNGEPNCPLNTVCVSDGNGRGTCCFGKPDPAPEVGTVIDNSNPVCGKCGGCEPGYICKREDVVCVRAPSPPIYRKKKEKPGSCPVWPAWLPVTCGHNRVHRCDNDYDCRGKSKCCASMCGIRFCLRRFLH